MMATDDDFDPIEMLFPPCGSGFVMALRAYFDASVREPSNLICVAGVAFGLQSAKKANSEWQSLFKNKICHMTDLHARRGEFEGISREEASSYLVEAVKIIKSHMAFAGIASFDMNELKEHLPSDAVRKHAKKMKMGFETPYALACHAAMFSLAYNTTNSIHYVFELGDKGQPGAKKYLEFIGEQEGPIAEAYRVGSLAYAKKESAHLLLGASDILAWEWGKDVERAKKNSGSDMRRSLAEILSNKPVLTLPSGAHLVRTDKFECQHFTGEKFQSILDQMGELLSSKDFEEVEAVRAKFRPPPHPAPRLRW